MKIENGLVVNDKTELALKLSEQGVLAMVMIIQKVFVDVAQDREALSIEDLFAATEFIIRNGELFVTNPVTFTVNKDMLCGEVDDDEYDDEYDDELSNVDLKERN